MILSSLALGSFFEIEKKPNSISQTCLFCRKDLRKNDLRVRAQCGTCRAGSGCGVRYVYGHFSCFMEAVRVKSKQLGFPIVISKEARSNFRKLKKQVKKEYLIEALKS